MFLSHGFDAVTVEEIAAECGVSVRTIPRYFPTKEAIALAPYRDDLERFKKDLANRDGDVISSWRLWVERVNLDMGAAETRLRKYWAMMSAAPSLDAGRLAIWQEYEDVMADAIAQETGDADGLRSRVFAAMLITGYAAVVRHVLSNDRHHVENEVFHRVLDHVAASFADFKLSTARRVLTSPRRTPGRRSS